MKRKYHQFRLLRPDNTFESIQVPVYWSAKNVADKLRHTDVFMFVPKSMHVMQVRNDQVGPHFVHGPCWVLWSRIHNAFYKVDEPVDADTAGRIALAAFRGE
jgi:hypothetical protein